MQDEKKSLLVQRTYMTTIRIIWQYIVSDIQKKPRSFKIGLFTIYLVVMFLSLVQSAFQLSTIIFIQLSETAAGDTDILIAPIAAQNDTSQNSDYSFGPDPQSSVLQNLTSYTNLLGSIKLINTSLVEKTISQMSSVYGESPRWLITGDLLNPNIKVNKISNKMRAFVLVMDSLHELSVGVGRRFEKNSVRDNEVYVSSSALRGLNISEGEPIDLNINIVDFLFTYSSTLSGVSEGSQTGEQKVEEQGRDFLNSFVIAPLRVQFGSGVIDAPLNSTELKDVIGLVDDFSQTVRNDSVYRQALEDYLYGQVNQSDLTQQQRTNLRNLIDNLLTTNTSSDVRILVDRVPDNTTFTIGSAILDMTPYVIQALNLTLNLKVKNSVGSPMGKWSSGLGNVVAMDYRNLTPYIVINFRKNLVRILDENSNGNSTTASIGRLLLIDPITDPLLNASYDLNLTDYALSSNFVLNDRVTMYSDAASIKNRVIGVTNQYYSLIGKNNPTQVSTPLAAQAQGFLIISNFLDNMVVTASFLLLMLSMLLIYSLMIGDVEEKTYEFGMLRALGFSKSWLVVLLSVEALIFAVPGLAIGLVSSYLLNSIICNLIFSSSQMISSYQLHYSAIALGVCIGFLVPLLSNILPIMRALSKTLRDSLDLYHRVVDEITVSVVKLEKLGLSLEQMMTASLLVIMGFVCYYLAPQAFIFQNIKLFLAIINIVLIIMIIGFTLIANLLQGPLERGLVWIMLKIYSKDQNLKQIILKNMQGHDRRNSKTTLMYTLALSFLIFAGTGFTLQTVVIEDILRSFIGSNMAVFTTDNVGLDEYNIRLFMNQTIERDPSFIRAYSFATYTMNQFPGMASCSLSPLSTFPSKKVQLIGVEENLLHSLDQRYYLPNEYDEGVSYPILESGQKDGVYGLYSREGNVDLPANSDIYRIQSNSQIRQSFAKNVEANQVLDAGIDREINLVLPEGYKYDTSMDVSTPARFTISGNIFRVKVRHMATKVPGFSFSGYRFITANGNGLLSMEDFAYIMNKYYQFDLQSGNLNSTNTQANFFFNQIPSNLSYNIPKDSLYIQYARPTTYNERVDFANGLRNYFKDDMTLLFDVVSLVEDTASTFAYINLFYIVVALISMTLSFFLLLVSFISNVRENSWEFGVLRAVGLNKGQITRVYIYEALGLIIASGLIGTTVGIVVAIAITQQIVIFTELPFTFLFPVGMFLITFLGGFLTATLGSYFAVREVRDKSISSILKGLL